MATASIIHAAGFGVKEGRNTSFQKAFLRHSQNAAAVDDLIDTLIAIGVYEGGNKCISLAEIDDLNEFEGMLEVYPHKGALDFVHEARKSEMPLEDWIIYIMVGESSRNPIEAELLRHTHKPKQKD